MADDDGISSDRAITTRGWGVEIDAAFERRDFAEALRLAESILQVDPGNPDAAQLADSARLRLRHSFIAACGALARVPRLIASADALSRLDIDAEAGFILALVGSMTVEEIADVVPLPQHVTLARLRMLVERGAIAIDR